MHKVSVKESLVLEKMSQRYQYDTIMLVATSEDHIPWVRSVDTFYSKGSFYIVTDLHQNYVKQLIKNPYVMISDGGHNRFSSKAVVLGHPLEEKNLQTREVYLDVFRNWYKEVNNESYDSVCFVKATPYKGYFHENKLGYQFDLEKDECIIDDIKFHIDVKLEPFF